MDFIYALCDPRDNRVRYIGKTGNLRRRYNQHLREKTDTHRTHWIQSLRKIGMNPHLIVIEQLVPGQDWEERERYWITHYRNKYDDLTNGTDGGDCGPRTKKGSKKSAATRAKMSAWQIGRKLSEKTRNKIGLAHQGKKDSPERIEQKRKWMTGRKFHTDEFKQRLAERNKIMKADPEKLRQASRKLWDDPIKGAEARKKLSERNRANHWSKGRKGDSQKAKSAARKLWDDPIKAASARAKLIERNKRNKWHNKTNSH